MVLSPPSLTKRLLLVLGDDDFGGKTEEDTEIDSATSDLFLRFSVDPAKISFWAPIFNVSIH